MLFRMLIVCKKIWKSLIMSSIFIIITDKKQKYILYYRDKDSEESKSPDNEINLLNPSKKSSKQSKSIGDPEYMLVIDVKEI